MRFVFADARGRHVQLMFQRSSSGATVTGCETARSAGGCNRTRRVQIDPAQLAQLENRWRNFAAGVRCRIRRPAGTWLPTRLSFDERTIDGLVWERADEGLSARCFAIERVGGWFLRIWRNAN